MSKSTEIQCSNPQCKKPNPLEQKFCYDCGNPITKRYLRAIGEGLEGYSKGNHGNGRYVFIAQNIVLETQPGILPYIPESIPNEIIPYLQLFPCRLNIPQVYGQLTNPEETEGDQAIWLLDYGSVLIQKENLTKGRFFPLMIEKWRESPVIRKLNWLRQIASLWNILAKKGVVSTLLNGDLLGVNGGILQVLELEMDQGKSHSLKELGHFWQDLIKGIKQPKFKDFFTELCDRLITEKIHSPKQLLSLLDYGLEKYGQTQENTYQIYTLTDSGPSRDHNEDSCYPDSGTITNINLNEKALAIVCDGIGGHEGGEIASQLAIETLAKELGNLDLENDGYSGDDIINHLQQSTFLANTKITEVNDKEHRQERQRMGTTLVMTLGYKNQMYLSHVGDSRIYLITRRGVSQLTLDDDLASREVRLGYAIYRDAVRYPSAGALVQALGMGSSNNLHPTVQRLIFDEECIFLLCSDGLSDFDRVDQYWDKEILPLLDSHSNAEINLEIVGQKLIAIANTRNGHDNSTIALVHCQIKPSVQYKEDQIVLDWEQIDEKKIIPDVPLPSTKIYTTDSLEADIETRPLSEEFENPKTPFVLFLSLIGVLVLGAGVFAFWNPIKDFITKKTSEIENNETVTPVLPPTPTVTPTDSTDTPDNVSPVDNTLDLEVGQLYVIKEKLTLITKQEESNDTAKLEIPQDSIIKFISKEEDKNNFQVCHIPQNNSSSVNNGKIGDQGFILSRQLQKTQYEKYTLKEGEKPPRGILNECLKE
jgi:protein phosphatase